MDIAAWGPPIDVLPVFRQEQRELLDLLRGLSIDQWHAATSCTGWNVHDLATHVLGNHLGRLSRERDGYRALAPHPGEDIPVFVHRLNAEWVTATARLSPTVVMGLLPLATDALFEYWESADRYELGEPVFWAGPDPAPRWLDVAREYTESWVHQQQIRAAVGAPPLDDAHFRAPVVDTFVRALPNTLRDTRVPDGTEVTVTVTGDSGGQWTATRQGDGWALAPGPGRAPRASISTDADTFWRLCTHEITPEQADVTATGETDLANDALRILSIIR